MKQAQMERGSALARDPRGNAGNDISAVQFTSRAYAEQYSEACGKAAAMNAYNYGVLPALSVARLFSRNPKWRSA